MDPTFIKEKEKPQTHLLLAQKTPKTTSAPSPGPSTSAPVKETQKPDEISEESQPDPTEEALPSADTLPTDSSDSLPDVPFK